MVLPFGPVVVLCLVEKKNDGSNQKSGQDTGHHYVEYYWLKYFVAQKVINEDVQKAHHQCNCEYRAINNEVDYSNALFFGLELGLYHFYPVHVVMLLKVDEVVKTEPLKDLDADRQVLDDHLQSQKEIR